MQGFGGTVRDAVDSTATVDDAVCATTAVDVPSSNSQRVAHRAVSTTSRIIRSAC